MALVLTLIGVPPAEADEPLVSQAWNGTFSASPRGFFVCTHTPTSPVETPDCFLGYVVPEGKVGGGRLRAVGSGFQRSSNFPVLEDTWAEADAFTIAAGTASIDVTFPDLGRLQVRFLAGVGGPGWANSACPRTVLAYALAIGGMDGARVFPVTSVQGTLSRHQMTEEVTLYQSPQPIHCFAYFTGRASGAWRMSAPHSAGHRRFQLPPPLGGHRGRLPRWRGHRVQTPFVIGSPWWREPPVAPGAASPRR